VHLFCDEPGLRLVDRRMLKSGKGIGRPVKGPDVTDVGSLEKRVAALERLVASGPAGRGVRRKRGRTRPKLSRRAELAVFLGIVIGTTLVGTSLYIIPALAPPIPPGSVTLDGINMTLSYTPGSTTDVVPGPNYCANWCPVMFTGGDNYTIKVFSFFVGSGDYRGEIVSLNVSSALPFQAVICESPGPCGITHTYEASNISFRSFGGFAQSITVIVSDPAPSLPAGFWVYCNATITLTGT
jgi:hypothetical protein